MVENRLILDFLHSDLIAVLLSRSNNSLVSLYSS